MKHMECVEVQRNLLLPYMAAVVDNPSYTTPISLYH